MITETKKRNFDVTVIQSDGEKSVGSMKYELHELGIDLDISGPGQHVARVERMIRVVKERVRIYMSTLPYTMCKIMLIWCVYFCVSRINLQPSSQSTMFISPREKFTGKRINAKLDLKVGFGQYVQAVTPITNNSMDSRTEGCIALFPTGNLQGSTKMLSIATMRVVTRDNFTILPIPDIVLEQKIEKAARSDGIVRKRFVGDYNEHDGTPTTDGNDDGQVLNTDNNGVSVVNLNQPSFMEVRQRDDSDNCDNNNESRSIMADDPTMTLVDTTVEGQPVDNNSDTAAVVTVSHDPIGWVRRSVRNVITRSDSTINNNGNYDGNSDKIAHAFKISVHAAIKTYGDKAISVINDELRQMLEKKVFHGVLFTNLSKDERRNIIRSSMFLKEKFLSDGEFEKLKARLVASGDMQDREVYEIDLLSSSTAATSSVFLFAAVWAPRKDEQFYPQMSLLLIPQCLDESNGSESYHENQ
jgi:hypothetical protein